MAEIQLDPHLSEVLSMHQVQIMHPRQRMVQLSAVPAGPGFNKSLTNVLLRRRSEGGNWEVFVDEDLAYVGANADRGQLFSGARQKRWLEVLPPVPLHGDLNDAILRVLDWLDSPMCSRLPPVLPQSAQRGSVPGRLDPLLQRYGRLLSGQESGLNLIEPTTAQVDLVQRAAETVTRSVAPTCPLLSGPAGCGKTLMARLAGMELVRRGFVQQVVEMNMASICSGAIVWPERDERLRQVIEVLLHREQTVAILEQLDLTLFNGEVVTAILTEGLDRGLKLIAVARPEFTQQWLAVGGALERRLELVPVSEPEPEDLRQILQRRWQHHPLARQCELAPEVLPAVLALSRRRPGANPGAALGLLEGVLSHAAWSDRKCAGPDDVYHLISEEEV